MSIEHFLEILDRAHRGPICTDKEWRSKVIPTKVSQKLKEHGLQNTFDSENPVNTDDALADRFFKAGFELAVEIGFLCMDTERIITVTEEELRDAISNGASELVLGEGRDRVVMKNRQMEDEHPPVCEASLGLVVSEDIFVPLMTVIASLREVDIFHGGSLVTVNGRRVLGGTPYETLVGRYEIELKKEILWRAGRPGMCTDNIASSTTVFGQFGGFGVAGGIDPALTIAMILLPGDLCTNYTSFHKVIQSINCGSIKRVGFQSMIGGYPGPAEGVVLAQIAGFLLQFVIHEVDYASVNAMDVRYSGNCGRAGIWAINMMIQALGRNTHLLKNCISNQVAGPCTEMLLYELATSLMTFTASGVEVGILPRSGGGRYTDYLTPLECKFGAEVFKRSAGMTRKQVNEIAKTLLPRYEDKLKDPPKGKGVRECYDINTWQPTQDWLDIYLKVKRELVEMGIPLVLP